MRLTSVTRPLVRAALPLMLLAPAARAQKKTDSTIAPGSGAAMCNVLEPADFARVGLSVGAATGNVDDDGASAYCAYPSPAGKIEVDVFYGPATTAPQAIVIARTAMGEVGGQFKPVTLAGADEAQITSDGAGASAFTSIVFRRGTAVLSLGIPTSPRARDQLLALARIAIGRIHRT